jgi:hypothetical protein
MMNSFGRERFAAAAAFLALVSTASAQMPSADEQALLDTCMRAEDSTDAFCQCGIAHYKSNLTELEFSLVAELSRRIANGQPGNFEIVAAELAVPTEERETAFQHIAETAKTAADACDPLTDRPSGL